MRARISVLATLCLLSATAGWASTSGVDGKEAADVLERASDQLESGKYDAAAFTLQGVEFAEQSLRLMAETLLETAQLRKERLIEANDVTTARAVKIFEAIAREDSSPLALTRLAEALALSSREADQLRGHAILEKLNQANRIPDGYGYAILAHLRRLAGEDRAALKALTRCRLMVKGRESGCKLPATFKLPAVLRHSS